MDLNQAIEDTNVCFVGTYINPLTPAWLSAFSGASPGTNLQVSSLAIADTGYVILTAQGTSNDLQTSAIVAQRSAEFTADPVSQIKMINNNGLSVGPSENISIVNATDTFYDAMALGNLYVYGNQNATGSLNPPLGILTQYLNTSLMDIQGPGTYIANFLVSTVNGQPYGLTVTNPNLLLSTLTINNTGYIQTPLLTSENITNAYNITTSTVNGIEFPQPNAAISPDLSLSTLNINPLGLIRMNADGNLFSVKTAGLFFEKTPDVTALYSPGIKMVANTTKLPYAVSTIENISITFADAIQNKLLYDNLALGQLFVYGNENGVRDTNGQVAVLRPVSSTSTDLEIVTTGIHTTAAYISSLYVSSIVDYVLNVSTANVTQVIASTINTLASFAASTFTNTISSATASLATAIISSLQFPTIQINPTSGLLEGVKVDLGMGSFLGQAVGNLGGVAMNATIGTAALITGAVVLTNARTGNTIIVPGQTNASTFNLVNSQTQLQFSTLGTATSSFLRFVSSIDPSIVPGREEIISSIIPAGTLCLRSFSDPLNFPNPCTITSTIQSFGFWQPVPGGGGGSGSFTSLSVGPGAITAQAINAAALTTSGTITAGGTASLQNILAKSIVLSGTGTLNANVATIGNLNVASSGTIPNLTVTNINGSPYPPVAPPASISSFKQLFTSSFVASTIAVAQGITADTLNTTGGIIVQGIASLANIVTSGNINSLGNINCATLAANNITSAGNLTSPTATIPALTVTQINGAAYPPPPVPYSSTIIGNFIVTSTLIAYNISSITAVEAPYIIGANAVISYSQLYGQQLFVNDYANITSYLNVGGNLTCASQIQGDSIIGNSLNVVNTITAKNLITSGTIYPNAIVCATSIIAANASIGGITLGPGGVQNVPQLTAGNINATTATVPTLNVTTINGQSYPPTIPGGLISTFKQLFTSSLVVSTINSCNLNSTEAVIPTLTVTTINGQSYPPIIPAGLISTFSELFTSSFVASTISAVSAVIPTLTVTTINGASYPPITPTSAISTFKQLYTSSLLTSSINTCNMNVNGNLSVSNNLNVGLLLTGNIINGISGSYSGGLSMYSGSATTTFFANIFTANTVSVSGLASLNGGVAASFGLFSSYINVGTYINAASAQIGGTLTATTAIISGGVTAGTIAAPTGSITALTVTTINGIAYPPPTTQLISSFKTLSTSNFIVSTITASQPCFFTTLTTSGNINASAGIVFAGVLSAVNANIGANLTAGTISNTFSVTTGTLVSKGSITGTNANIGGVLVGPFGGINTTGDINTTSSINASTATLGLVFIDIYGNLTTPNALQGSYIYSTDIILANNNIQCGKSMVCSTISAKLGLILKGEVTQLEISSINGYQYPQPIETFSTINVVTINQANYVPTNYDSTLNINGNVNFSSLEGIQVQGGITGLGGLFITDGGAVIQGRTEILGDFIANNNVTLSTTSVFGDFNVIYPRQGTINNFASAQINPGLNNLATTQFIGNSCNWGQDQYAAGTSPPYYPLAMRQTGTTYQTGYSVISTITKGGYVAFPVGIDYRAPCVFQIYAWTAVDTFFGFWTAFAGNGPNGGDFSIYTTQVGAVSDLRIDPINTIRPPPATPSTRVGLTLRNISGTTDASNVNVSWTVFPGFPP